LKAENIVKKTFFKVPIFQHSAAPVRFHTGDERRWKIRAVI